MYGVQAKLNMLQTFSRDALSRTSVLLAPPDPHNETQTAHNLEVETLRVSRGDISVCMYTHLAKDCKHLRLK